MRARVVMAALAGVAYVAATHWLMTSAPQSDWNAVVVIGPMLVLAALWAWQRRWRGLAAGVVMATVALVVEAWHGGGLAPQTLYLAQHVAIHLLLALAFGATLAAGREPLITALARRVHTALTPDMVRYCRKVTAMWTLYFVAMAATSVAVFVLAPFTTWAVFANLATPLAMAALFVGEYVLRYQLHPEFERATLAQAVRAYSERSASRPGAPAAIAVPSALPHD